MMYTLPIQNPENRLIVQFFASQLFV